MNPIEKVKIRMYRHGLGDCFLITFYKKGESNSFNMLLDCGVLIGTKDGKKKMIDVANNIKKVTSGEINILVATHEHWDHLSGFLQAQSVFDSMKINEIWMAWTEDPNDKFAQKIKKIKNEKLNAVKLAFDKLKNQSTKNYNAKQKEGHEKYINAFNSFFNFYGIDSSDNILSANSVSGAFDTLRKRKNSDKLYLTPSNEVIEPTELPGVRIYILGPPKDEKALKKMNSSKKEDEIYKLNYNIFLDNSFNTALESKDKNKPFSDKECINKTRAKGCYSSYFDPLNNWRMIDDDWLYSAGNLAIAVDGYVNNTSLTFAIELIDSGKVFIFPADAQVGNWLSWSNYKWNVKTKDKKETLTIDDLLNRTVFYKVGHHGSHNATMKEHGLEKMNNSELIAMIPVDQKMAKVKDWKMPFKPLLEILKDKTKDKVIIMDEEYPQKINSINKTKDGINDLYYDVVIHNK